MTRRRDERGLTRGLPTVIVPASGVHDTFQRGAQMQAHRFTRGRRVLVPFATALLAATVLTPGSMLGATPYGSNLVANGSFQNGLVGWDQAFLTTQVRTYSPATGGFPSPAQGSKIGGGSKFLYLGMPSGDQCPQVEQHLMLKGIGKSIDQGRVKVRLRGYVATQGGASFNAHLDLYYRDANNHVVPNAPNGIVRVAKQTNQKYVKIDVTRKLPKGTRQLYLKLWADGDDPQSNSDCPGFYDKISVVLSRS